MSLKVKFNMSIKSIKYIELSSSSIKLKQMRVHNTLRENHGATLVLVTEMRSGGKKPLREIKAGETLFSVERIICGSSEANDLNLRSPP